MSVDEMVDEKKKKKDKKRSREHETDEEKAERKRLKKAKKEKKRKRAEVDEKEPGPSTKKTKVDSSSSAAAASAFLAKHAITTSVPVVPVTSFSQLSIPQPLQACFKSFTEPTPVQACTWPPALEGKDVVGIAETGSGKTLAFGIPALARLMSASEKEKEAGIRVLVVAPTRELAVQTHDTLSEVGKQEGVGVGCVCVYGGVPKEGQVKMLRKAGKKGVRIVVGTPGRILDLVQEGSCDLSGVEYLVLDEADRMLDKGFENDIRKIISNTKQGKDRQTMMFSATWPEAVRRLASTFQNNPVRVTVGSEDLQANSRVLQKLDIFDDERSKDQRLLKHIRALLSSSQRDDFQIIVFCLYKKETPRIEQLLLRHNFSVAALHGDLSQPARTAALDAFRSGTKTVLVATDVAARGLDIPSVGAVINYTFPLTVEEYVHRIGRTGRGGRTGTSITFFTGSGHERSLAGELSRLLQDAGVDCTELREKFPMTIKKREHSVYGAHFRDDIAMPKGPQRIVFD